MFSPGEKIIYGSTGVCTVKEVTSQNIFEGAEEKLYYTLEPMYQSGVIYIPVDSKVFMRPVISKAEVNALIDGIPHVSVKVCQSSAIRELEEYYSSFLKTHDCAKLIQLACSISAKKKLMAQKNRKFGAVDERYMKRAEDLLFGEFAAALDIGKDQVASYIEHRLLSTSHSD